MEARQPKFTAPTSLLHKGAPLAQGFNFKITTREAERTVSSLGPGTDFKTATAPTSKVAKSALAAPMKQNFGFGSMPPPAPRSFQV